MSETLGNTTKNVVDYGKKNPGFYHKLGRTTPGRSSMTPPPPCRKQEVNGCFTL